MTTAITSAKACLRGESMPTIAVMRICAPFRSAIQVPSRPSQRKQSEASSSDQTKGLSSTYRAVTPAKSTTTSTTTRMTAGISIT